MVTRTHPEVDRFVWRPDPADIGRTRVSQFARSNDLGIEDLFALASSEPAWFWEAVVADLGIPFRRPFDRVVEWGTDGISGRWFIGGELNVADACVDRWAADATTRERVAVIDEREDGEVRSWTYAELHRRSSALAGLLRRLGVGRGDAVGIYMPMSAEAIAAYFAIVKLGAVIVPMFSGFGPDALRSRLERSHAVALVTANGFSRRNVRRDMKQVVDAALQGFPAIGHVVVHDHCADRAGTTMVAGRDVWWEDGVEESSAVVTSEMVDSEHPLLYAYTSGTSGPPKGAVLVHGGVLVKMASEAAYAFDMRSDDRLHWITDLGWVMGTWQAIGAMSVGASIVVSEGAPDWPHAAALWDRVERHDITVLGVSPTLIRSIRSREPRRPNPARPSKLRVLGSTGESWDPSSWLWFFREFGDAELPIINISGGTEVGGAFLSCYPTDPLKPTTVGRPSLGMQIDVVDAQGHSILAAPSTRSSEESLGELVCTRPWPSMTRSLLDEPKRYFDSYWRRFPGLWAHGDLASVDEDGLWYLHGRSDDTLNLSGKRLGPEEMESAAVQVQGVAEVAAVQIPSKDNEVNVVCFVVLSPEGQDISNDPAFPSAVTAAVGAALGKAFRPSLVVLVEELPKTRSGKVVRRAVRSVCAGVDPGDLSSLENPEVLPRIADSFHAAVGLDSGTAGS